MAKESSSCPPEPMDSEDMLFMLYTSGSTGKPKGIVHTQAGYLLYASLTQQVRYMCDCSNFSNLCHVTPFSPHTHTHTHTHTHIHTYTHTFYLFQYAFDYHPDKDIFACVADIGWITGHSYVVYGPLCNGGTTVMFESVPTYPDPGIGMKIN